MAEVVDAAKVITSVAEVAYILEHSYHLKSKTVTMVTLNLWSKKDNWILQIAWYFFLIMN